MKRLLIHWRLNLVIAGIVLAGYYFAVFRPLANRERELNEPILELNEEVEAVTSSHPRIRRLTLENLQQLEAELEQSLSAIREAREAVEQYFSFPETTRLNAASSFLVLDYQNARLAAMDRLTQQAEESKVTLAGGVLTSLPQYTIDNPRPGLLWMQLELSDLVMASAISLKPEQIAQLEVLPPEFHYSSLTGSSSTVEIPLHIRVVGRWEELSKILMILFLDPPERRKLELPERPAETGVVLRRLMLRKLEAQPEGRVVMDLQLAGFADLNEIETP